MPTPSLQKVLIIGSGPIKIGHTGAFDNAACRACEVMQQAGIQTVMLHCDPSALATDLDTAHRTYMLPLTIQSLTEVILREKPDGLLPTVGGPAALRLAKSCLQNGFLKDNGVRLLGASASSLALIDDPEAFFQAADELGITTPQGRIADNVADAAAIAEAMEYPVFVRALDPAGVLRQAIAYNVEELRTLASVGRLPRDPVGSLRIENALTGCREIEVELLRDAADHIKVVALAENMDPVGIHSGDSLAAIPALTIDAQTRGEIEAAAGKLAAKLATTGSLHLKFAWSPAEQHLLVLSANPCFSRMSGFCSKAMGIDLAAAHARLSLGAKMEEKDLAGIQSGGITVVRLPRWEFNRFSGEKARLDAAMKSTGEVMGLGCSLAEAIQRARRCRSPRRTQQPELAELPLDELVRRLVPPSPLRLEIISEALTKGADPEALSATTGIDARWIKALAPMADATGQPRPVDAREQPRIWFHTANESTSKHSPSGKSVLVVGPGSGRIGHGIELDHCCVHAARTLRAAGRQAMLANANPGAAGSITDFDRIFVTPLNSADIQAVCRSEKPDGVILQFGGYAAMDLAEDLDAAGFKVLGTAPGQVARSRDRLQFSKLLTRMGIPHPRIGLADSPEQAMNLAEAMGYPLVVSVPADRQRSRYTIIMDPAMLEQDLMQTKVSETSPMLLEQFLEYAVEVEADALCDGKAVYVPAVMEHIELAGVHSGDVSMVVPPYSTPPRHVETIHAHIRRVALELDIVGLLNARFAVFNDTVYMLAARPWACRTLPMISKICDVPMARRAVAVMLGTPLDEMDLPRRLLPHYSIRSSVFPFEAFPRADPLLTPQMRATGQVMAQGEVFGMAYHTAQKAAGPGLPQKGNLLITVTDADKPSILEPARLFQEMGFGILATRGTHGFLKKNGIEARLVKKLGFGRPDLVDAIKTGEVAIVVNTPSGRQSQQDDALIRKTAIRYNIPNITTPAGALAAAKGIAARKQGQVGLCTLQDYAGSIR
jgi:carbamoyl-phosphate synthase large subunit